MCGVTVDIEALPVAAFVISAPEGSVLRTNRLAGELPGGEPGSVGRPFETLAGDDDGRSAIRDALARACDRSDQPGPVEVVVRAVGDPARWLQLRFAAAGDDVVVVAEDVTEHRRVFRVLRESLQTVALVGDQGERLWGPVGREHPEDRPAEVPGSSMDRVHPEDQARVVEAWSRVHDEPGRREQVRCRLRAVDLGERWGEVIIELANHGSIPEIGGLLVSIREGAVAEEVSSIGHTGAAYLSVAEAAPVGIVLTGPKGFPIYFNHAMQQILPGVGAGGAERDWLGRADPGVVDELRSWFEDLVEALGSGSRTVRFDAESAHPRWLLITVAPRRAGESDHVGFVVTLQDVTSEVEVRHQLERAQERLVRLATHDPLTGLANRTLLEQWLDERRDQGDSAVEHAVVYLDLDGFKRVNDELGHHAGDQILVATADRLRALCPADGLAVRLGGDEFLLVAPATGDVSLRLASIATAALDEPVVVDGRSLRAGASVGVAGWRPGEPFDGALRRADAAMYDQKLRRRSTT